MIHAIAKMTVTDPEMLAAYRAQAADALARHGGAVVTASPNPTLLEGDGPAPNIMALLSFPDRDAALGWINDPELAPVHAKRNAAGQSEILLIG